MSLALNELVDSILCEYFGSISSKIAFSIRARGCSTMKDILYDSVSHGKPQLKLTEIKKCLCNLIRYNVINVRKDNKGLLTYSYDPQMVLAIMRYSSFIHLIMTRFSEIEAAVCRVILMSGQICASSAIIKASNYLNKSASNCSDVISALDRLVTHRFFHQCSDIVVQTNLSEEENPDSIEKQRSQKYPEFSLPKCDIKSYVYRVLSDNDQVATKSEPQDADESEPPLKRRKTIVEADIKKDDKAPDSNILFCLNLERFLQLWRDEILIKTSERRIDKRAGTLLRSILQKLENNGDLSSGQSALISHVEIVRNLPSELSDLNAAHFDQYMLLLCDDQGEFLMKTGLSTGGTYACPYKRSIANLAVAHMESTILERFGTKGLRLFRFLKFESYTDGDELERRILMPPTECRSLLPKMVSEGFVGKTELSKTKEYFAQSIYCYYKVNMNQLARMLREWCYRGLARVIIRRKQEISDKQRLITKQEHCNDLLKVLDHRLAQTPVDEEEVAMIMERKEFLEGQMTHTEKEQLNWLEKAVSRLSTAELELDETSFILDYYLLYHD